MKFLEVIIHNHIKIVTLKKVNQSADKSKLWLLRSKALCLHKSVLCWNRNVTVIKSKNSHSHASCRPWKTNPPHPPNKPWKTRTNSQYIFNFLFCFFRTQLLRLIELYYWLYKHTILIYEEVNQTNIIKDYTFKFWKHNYGIL